MQFTTLLTTLLLSSASVLAAPAPAPAPAVIEERAAQWTIQQFTRTCNQGDTSCRYSFGVAGAGPTTTRCVYDAAGQPASRASVNDVRCDAFRVSSNWSGQFGAGKGFTTLAVVKDRQIVYPAYTDAELVNGKAVSPDKSYTVQNLP